MEKQWKKLSSLTTDIEIAAFLPQLITMIKSGNPIVENVRCIFQLENDPCIYLLPALDYVDIKPERKIVSLSIYQMVN